MRTTRNGRGSMIPATSYFAAPNGRWCSPWRRSSPPSIAARAIGKSGSAAPSGAGRGSFRGQIGNRLRHAVPADLVHAVIDLVRDGVGVGDGEVPVGAALVAPAGPGDPGLLLGQPAPPFDDLAQCPDLPRHVADPGGAFALGLARGSEGPVREQHHRMMIRADAQEIAVRVLAGGAGDVELLTEIDRVGDGEAEQVAVEAQRGLLIRDVEAEMPEPLHPERPREANPAHVVAAIERLLCGVHGVAPSSWRTRIPGPRVSRAARRGKTLHPWRSSHGPRRNSADPPHRRPNRGHRSAPRGRRGDDRRIAPHLARRGRARVPRPGSEPGRPAGRHRLFREDRRAGAAQGIPPAGLWAPPRRRHADLEHPRERRAHRLAARRRDDVPPRHAARQGAAQGHLPLFGRGAVLGRQHALRQLHHRLRHHAGGAAPASRGAQGVPPLQLRLGAEGRRQGHARLRRIRCIRCSAPTRTPAARRSMSTG